MSLKVPPLLLMIALAVALMLIDLIAPAWSVRFPGQKILALAVGLPGAALLAHAGWAFRRAKTTVNPMKPETSSKLVVHGLYRFSRNPMYLGMLLMLIATTVATGTAAGLVAAPSFIWYMNRFQIAAEESALEARFGADFRSYCDQVRRWI